MSHRKNEDRFGSTNIDSDPPMPMMPPHLASGQHMQANPLSFVSPTEFVELPSEGKFYVQGHPLHHQKVIELRHMTAKEEDILTSQSLLKKGVAIDRFLQSLIVDKRINTDDILVGDKNAILVNARINGYGPDYKTSVTCPNCQANIKHEFDLNEAKVKNVEDVSELKNVHIDENMGLITIQLPITGWSFVCKPMTGKDERTLSEAIETRRKRKLSEDMLSQQINLFTVSISGVTDRGKIIQAIQSLPARDSKYLRQTYQKLMPSLDLTQTFECSECRHTCDMEVPFTTDFFWPKQ
jgi:hypothetical protein